MKLIFLLHLGATGFMAGVIWIVQVVHYPLFAQVGAEGFAGYAANHARLITYVVLPVMTLELFTAIALVYRPLPAWPLWMVWAGLALVGVIWLSTALLQVPAHNILAGGFNEEAYHRLVQSNWIRTLAWSARLGLVLWMAGRLWSAPQ